MVICGDINLPNIFWDSVDSASGANVLPFIEALHDHFLTQINNTPTRGSNILDLVITSAPEHTRVTDMLSTVFLRIIVQSCLRTILLSMRPDTRANLSTSTQMTIFKVWVKLSRQSIFLLLWAITI